MTTTVLVDAWQLGVSGARGIGTYLRHVLTGLGARSELDVRALTVDPAALPAGIEPIRIHRHAPGRFQRREHELLLPFALARHRADVVFSPAQDPPSRSRAPFVQMLHDVTPLVIDDPELDEDRTRLLRLADRYRSATAYIANSTYTADSCSEHLGIPRDRIWVALLGVGDEFTPGPAPPADDPYLLVVGEYGANKGYAEAFEAIGAIADAGLPHRLKVAGRLAPWWEPSVRRLVDAAPRPDRIDVLGYVDDLVSLYRGADAMLMTSRHEGFGFPIAEAMACGTPVVAFANSSLPEVVGDGGVVVADGDVGSMVSAVEPLLRDPAARGAASSLALRRASAFSWEACVDVHVEALLTAAG